MIKVVHVVGKMDRGGLETLLMNYYRAIDRNKVSFDFIVVTKGKGEYDDEIVSLGGHIFHTPQYRWNNKRDFLRWWDSFLSNNKYDIVHQHNFGASSEYFSLVKKYNVITVLHSHCEYYPKTLRQVVKRYIQNRAFHYTDYYFACSKEAGESLFGNRKFQIIRNAIDVDRFAFSEIARKRIRQELNISESTFLVGCVGRMTEEKNHLFALDVIKEVLKYKPNTHFLLIGQGELYSCIVKKINVLRIENYVTIISPVSNIDEYYMAMDCFIFPSLHEGLGMVAVEAQATGLPVVMSNTIPTKAVIHNVTRLDLENSTEQWAKSLIESKATDREEGVKHVKDAGYDIHQNAVELTKLYTEMVRK